MRRIRKYIIALILVMMIVAILGGCQREADKVSYNLSLEADNFNVTRQLTVINTRTDTILFQMTGNFSINKEADGDLAIIGEEPDGTYYKHFVYLTRDVTYVTQQIATNSVNKYKFTVNYNPEMIIPVEISTVD